MGTCPLLANLSICQVHPFPCVPSPVQASEGARGKSGQCLSWTSGGTDHRAMGQHEEHRQLWATGRAEGAEPEQPEPASWPKQRSKCAHGRVHGRRAARDFHVETLAFMKQNVLAPFHR